MRRVVVTGVGTVNPVGLNARDTWGALIRGESGITRLTRFDATGWDATCAGEVKGFDGAAVIGGREVRRLGLFTQYAIAAADEALADAGFALDGRRPDGDRFGVYIGTGIGGLPEIFENSGIVLRDGAAALSPFFIPKALNNLATGQVAIRWGARGPSLVVSTACAAGNHSIGEAWRAIRTDDADVIVTGGTEAALSPLGYGGFMAMKAMSRQSDPSIASRPFDRDRDGFVMGEGAGVLVLESLAHAQARGARIYAELVGYGLSTDAHHITAPSPGGEGAARAMRMALRSAGIVAEQVGYINAHGTSTPANDPTEVQAIKAVFGGHASALAVSSTKGATGHLLGAAGGVEAVATTLAVHHGILPPTVGLKNPDPTCDLNHLPGEAAARQVDYALSNAFGFGGTNATLVFRRWEDTCG